ncbi:CBM96 family carbohydrate-binding protein [Microbacterium proteolyticum]|uniref:CBM96 family carbohydrate-binding protein n=1 Tax=Microbacterium proteolyticum TaxID=1572644 RepID=UPI0035BF4CAB
MSIVVTKVRWIPSSIVATFVLIGSLLVPIVPAHGAVAADLTNISARVTSNHPRLMADSGRFAALRSQVRTDAFSTKTYTSIVQSADALLTKAVLTYVKPDGVRMLDTSRALVERSYTLGLAWQISGDSKYAERLWKDLDAVTRFADWNPDHFLDTAEMTHGAAIGYDWLYSYWSSARRTQLSTAIGKLGLTPALAVYDAPADSSGPYAHGGNWAQGTNNWNVVVNAGLAVGALAIAQDDPALADKVLSSAIASVPKGLATYAEGGGWPEGLSYWDYATRYLIVMIQSLRSGTGEDFGLAGLPGLSDTGFFPIYATSPVGRRFNFGDTEDGTSRTPTLAGLGEIYNNPSFTYAGINEARGGNQVYRLLWHSPGRAALSPSAANLPLDRNFENSAVATFRSSWNDTNATYLGFRTGSRPDAAHQQLDAGSFFLEALGQNWATELGKDDYGLAGYFDSGVDGDRWNYYRLNAEGQNSLIINPYRANPTKVVATPAARFESNAVSGLAVADLSALYADDVTSWKRGVRLFDGRQEALVQDEITTSRPFEALWSMHTKAAITVAADGRSATLTLEGKQLLARIISDNATAVFTDAPALPLPSSPHPAQQTSNDGVRKLQILFSATGDTTLAVQFSPILTASAPTLTTLQDWQLEPEGASRATGLRVNGFEVPGFSPSVFFYTSRWDPASTVPSVAAYKTGATVTSTLPASIPGIASTTITEPGKSPSTYRVFIDKGPIAITSATATRTTAGNPALTFDGDPSTYWSTWLDNSITYTLPQARSIKSLVIDWRANSSKHTKFELDTSYNGSTWTSRYDGAYDGSSGSQLIVPATSAWSRYVRITGHGDQASDPRTSIGEVTLYSYNATPPSVTPDPARLGSLAVSGVPSAMSAAQTATLAFTASSAKGGSIPVSSLSSVRYVTADPAIATISESGVVTAMGGGETTVGVIATLGRITQTAFVRIKVSDPLRVRIYANADAYVRGGTTEGTNYGKDSQLAVKPASPGMKDESYTRLAYLGFDLSSIAGKKVATASLNLNAAVTEPSGSAVRLDAHAVEGAWTESGLTYSNRPALGATVGSMALDAAFATRSGDLTDFVAAKAAASSPTLSLGLTQDTPFLTGAPLIAQVKSRESSTPPYIDVVLEPTSLAISRADATYTTSGSPADTYDGNPATYWSTWNVNSIKYTFAQAQAVKSAKITWRANSSQRTKFELQTSANGTTWTTQFDGLYEGPSGEQTLVMANAPAVKYVRIVGRGDQASQPRTSIAEVQFFPTDVTAAAPTRLPLHISAAAITGLPDTLSLDDSAQIAYTATSTTGVTMDPGSLTASFASSNPSVLSVDAAGVVTPLTVGTSTVDIVVTANGASVKQTVNVTVTDPLKLRIYANADAYVRGGATAATNYGTDSRLSIKPASPGMTDESYTRIAYMSFDLSQIKGKKVASATLSVNTAITESTGDSVRLDAHAVDAAWNESTVTYATRPAMGANVGNTLVDRTFDYRTLDLTGYLASKASASADSASIAFTQDVPFVSGKPLIVQVRSRESTVPPYIDIVLTK